VELAESLQSASIPGYRSLSTFSLFGFTINDVPVTTLEASVRLDVYVPEMQGIQALAASSITTPTIRIWDAQSSLWRELPTTWEPSTRRATVTTDQIGTFAVSVRSYKTHLPMILKHPD
jgi:hypothetical protein